MKKKKNNVLTLSRSEIGKSLGRNINTSASHDGKLISYIRNTIRSIIMMLTYVTKSGYETSFDHACATFGIEIDVYFQNI